MVEKSILEIVSEALKRGEIESLLKGEKSYGLAHPEFAPTEMPTDWDKMLKEGIYELYKTDSSLVNARTLEEGLLKILSDTHGIYASLNIFWRQLMNEKYGSAPFVMNKNRVIKALSRSLPLHKEEFLVDKRWMGSIEDDGLWGEIRRICRIIKEDFNINIISL